MMIKFKSILLVMGVFLMFSACSTPQLEDKEQKTPEFLVEQYFNGPVKAWGLVQSRSGKVIRRFEVDMVGKWNGNEGTLDESFDYYDGKKQYRTWHITKLADGSYEGRASDIFGKAVGHVQGGSMQWKYDMDLEVGDSKYRITFDDRMFLMRDGVLINRSYLKKFGFKVSELTIFMQRQKP